jgi:predicted component of type VI protein secretion system
MAESQAQSPIPHGAAAAEAGTAAFAQVLEETEKRALEVTKPADKARMEELLETLKEEALRGTISWSKNLTGTLKETLAQIDALISRQLGAVMHTEEFQKLEGSWRGLHHLVDKSETGESLKIRALNVGKKDLHKDLSRAVEFDQSTIFKKVYENEFGTPGGEPYGALIGDYEFTTHPEDVELATKMSNVAAAGFCPFLTAASPALLASATGPSSPSPATWRRSSRRPSTRRGARSARATTRASSPSPCRASWRACPTARTPGPWRSSTTRRSSWTRRAWRRAWPTRTTAG